MHETLLDYLESGDLDVGLFVWDVIQDDEYDNLDQTVMQINDYLIFDYSLPSNMHSSNNGPFVIYAEISEDDDINSPIDGYYPGENFVIDDYIIAHDNPHFEEFTEHGARSVIAGLDFDLDVTGSSNVFTTVIEVDDATYDVDVSGSSNDVNTSQTDGAYHKIDLELVQSNANVDIVQSSGTCPTGVNSCHSEIIAEFDSENATITINQKDTGD